jgi:hypothetical protein
MTIVFGRIRLEDNKIEIMKNIRVLILEDDLETVEKIFNVLGKIENDEKIAFGVTVIPDYIQVEGLINKNPQIKFDILLLDRDCFLGGSFHNINLKNFDIDKVISISSVPAYNDQAKDLGVKRIVSKDYSDLSIFAKNLEMELIYII